MDYKIKQLESVKAIFKGSEKSFCRFLSKDEIIRVEKGATRFFKYSAPSCNYHEIYRFNFSSSFIWMVTNETHSDTVPYYCFSRVGYLPKIAAEIISLCANNKILMDELVSRYKRDQKQKQDRLIKWARNNPYEAGLYDMD